MHSQYTQYISYRVCTITYICSYLQHWIKINKPVNRFVEWPTGRYGHAATCVMSGPLLVIVGGLSDRWNTTSDCWIHDLTTMKKKVICVVHVYTMFGCGPAAATTSRHYDRTILPLTLCNTTITTQCVAGSFWWREITLW